MYYIVNTQKERPMKKNTKDTSIVFRTQESKKKAFQRAIKKRSKRIQIDLTPSMVLNQCMDMVIEAEK